MSFGFEESGVKRIVKTVRAFESGQLDTARQPRPRPPIPDVPNLYVQALADIADGHAGQAVILAGTRDPDTDAVTWATTTGFIDVVNQTGRTILAYENVVADWETQSGFYVVWRQSLGGRYSAHTNVNKSLTSSPDLLDKFVTDKNEGGLVSLSGGYLFTFLRAARVNVLYRTLFGRVGTPTVVCTAQGILRYGNPGGDAPIIGSSIEAEFSLAVEGGLLALGDSFQVTLDVVKDDLVFVNVSQPIGADTCFCWSSATYPERACTMLIEEL